jgi:hypothetical protein
MTRGVTRLVEENNEEALKVFIDADITKIRKSIHNARAKERPPYLTITLQALQDAFNDLDVTTKLQKHFVLGLM